MTPTQYCECALFDKCSGHLRGFQCLQYFELSCVCTCVDVGIIVGAQYNNDYEGSVVVSGVDWWLAGYGG